MKVIDLINKISNDEEVPQRIKCNDIEFEYVGGAYEDEKGNDLLYYDFSCSRFLNKEIEIIEEKKIPKKLDIKDDKNTITLYGEKENEWTILDNVDVIICNKINSIIDYLKSKEN